MIRWLRRLWASFWIWWLGPQEFAERASVHQAITAAGGGQLGATAILRACAYSLDKNLDMNSSFGSQIRNAESMNIVHVLAMLMGEDITSERITMLYIHGCKENLMVFAMLAQAATREFFEDEQRVFRDMLHLGISGEADLTGHITLSPSAVADMMEIEQTVSAETGKPPKPVGEVSVDDLIERYMTEKEIADAHRNGP